jgi:glycerophosphoryl diester phosphodiesterase
MIETDLRMSSDGRIILSHDDVDRNRQINESNLVDLKMLGPIAQISDVLRLLNGELPLNLEIKEPEVVEPLAHTLKKCMQYGWKPEHFLVSSFNHHALAHFKRLVPNVRIGALLEGIPLDYSNFASALGAYSVHLSHQFVNREFVEHAHDNGLKVLVYTVNDFSVLDKMRGLGVDGIFTDYPGEAVAYLDNLKVEA